MTDDPGFAVRTDTGWVRTGNEDRALARPPVFAIADGMGGHQAGEVAAQLAMDLLGDVIGPDAPAEAAIVAAIEGANSAIRRDARGRTDLAGMGTTCTVATIADTIRIAHVGDSRAYRYRAGRLERLTDDHSLVARLVRDGIIDPDDAARDGRRNIVTRALGADDAVQVDVVTVDVAAGDRLLLCTDGLHGQVADAIIATVLADVRDPGQAADRLVELANAAGGDDNVTVIVVEVDRFASGAAPAGALSTPPRPEEQTVRRRARRRPGRRAALLLMLVIGAVVVALAVWLTVAWFGSVRA